jgi:hypothetical protein
MFLLADTSSICDCGHERSLHDRYGCAAFLGAYPKTAQQKRYCLCRAARAHDEAPSPLLEDIVVATVRVRERRGTAIAVCEFPPALELGGSFKDVIDRMKARLLDVVSPSSRGAAQMVHVIREDAGEERFEKLRRPRYF